MSRYSHPVFEKMKGQYLLTAESKAALEGWHFFTQGEWKLFTNGLPVINVYSEEDDWIGWCLGHPIVDGVLEPERIVLKKSTNTVDPYEHFYERATGKWVLALVNAKEQSIYLDPYGSLPTVYSTIEQTVASTPTLIGSDSDWDEQLMSELGFPQQLYWLPSGLTFKKNVRRLLANHCLSINQWKVTRHWPTPTTDLSIDEDIDSALARITDTIRTTISATAKKFPLCLTITGGMDSRVALACARKHINEAKIITFANDRAKLDLFIAKRLAKNLKLNHEFLPIQSATPEQLEEWQKITGRSVAGDIWKIHRTLTQLDSDRVLISGQSGEVHKGNYWRPGDVADSKITATEVLKRCNFQPHPVVLKATEEWLTGLSYVNTFVKLDLVHIEQRLSCWGAIQSFGNLTSKFEIPPSGSRVVFKSMMRLPHHFRLKKQLPYEICKTEWPELLQLPFNEYPGVYGYFRSRARRFKKMVKRMIEDRRN